MEYIENLKKLLENEFRDYGNYVTYEITLGNTISEYHYYYEVYKVKFLNFFGASGIKIYFSVYANKIYIHGGNRVVIKEFIEPNSYSIRHFWEKITCEIIKLKGLKE